MKLTQLVYITGCDINIYLIIPDVPNSFTLLGSTLYIHLWYRYMKNTISVYTKNKFNLKIEF